MPPPPPSPQVAGKRKALLDEMSIKEQQAASEQIRKHDLMEEKHIVSLL